jgi:hypothetical protein
VLSFYSRQISKQAFIWLRENKNRKQVDKLVESKGTMHKFVLMNETTMNFEQVDESMNVCGFMMILFILYGNKNFSGGSIHGVHSGSFEISHA